MSLLATERLILRPFTPDDFDAAYEILEGHPDVWKYDPGYPRTREQRRQELEFRILEYARQGFGCLAVTRQADQALLGYCGLQTYLLHRRPYTTPEVELFYKLGRAYWGQGYALEACRAQIGFAFERLRLERLVSWTAARNERSIRLLRRLGMKIESAPESQEDVIGILDHPDRAR